MLDAAAPFDSPGFYPMTTKKKDPLQELNDLNKRPVQPQVKVTTPPPEIGAPYEYASTQLPSYVKRDPYTILDWFTVAHGPYSGIDTFWIEDLDQDYLLLSGDLWYSVSDTTPSPGTSNPNSTSYIELQVWRQVNGSGQKVFVVNLLGFYQLQHIEFGGKDIVLRAGDSVKIYAVTNVPTYIDIEVAYCLNLQPFR